MPYDPFEHNQYGLDHPFTGGVAVTPDDNTDLATLPRFLYVGTGGDLQVKLRDDDSPVVIPDVPGGTYHPLRAVRVYATNTTASGIVALW